MCVWPANSPTGRPEFLVFLGWYQLDLQEHFLGNFCRETSHNPAGNRLTYYAQERNSAGWSAPGSPDSERILLLSRLALQAVEHDLRPGDRLVLFSDGLVEAIRPDGSPIGYEWLAARLPALLGTSPTDTEANLRGWATAKTAGAPLADDVTIVAVHVEGGVATRPS